MEDEPEFNPLTSMFQHHSWQDSVNEEPSYSDPFVQQNQINIKNESGNRESVISIRSLSREDDEESRTESTIQKFKSSQKSKQSVEQHPQVELKISSTTRNEIPAHVKTFKCPKDSCELEFFTKIERFHHMRTTGHDPDDSEITRTSKYYCYCGDKFMMKREYVDHVRLNHNVKIRCNTCDRVMFNDNSCQKHISEDHGSGFFTVNILTKKTVDDKSVFECSTCNLEFENFDGYKKHSEGNEHYGNSTFFCDGTWRRGFVKNKSNIANLKTVQAKPIKSKPQKTSTKSSKSKIEFIELAQEVHEKYPVNSLVNENYDESGESSEDEFEFSKILSLVLQKSDKFQRKLLNFLNIKFGEDQNFQDHADTMEISPKVAKNSTKVARKSTARSYVAKATKRTPKINIKIEKEFSDSYEIYEEPLIKKCRPRFIEYSPKLAPRPWLPKPQTFSYNEVFPVTILENDTKLTSEPTVYIENITVPSTRVIVTESGDFIENTEDIEEQNSSDSEDEEAFKGRKIMSFGRINNQINDDSNSINSCGVRNHKGFENGNEQPVENQFEVTNIRTSYNNDSKISLTGLNKDVNDEQSSIQNHEYVQESMDNFNYQQNANLNSSQSKISEKSLQNNNELSNWKKSIKLEPKSTSNVIVHEPEVSNNSNDHTSSPEILRSDFINQTSPAPNTIILNSTSNQTETNLDNFENSDLLVQLSEEAVKDHIIHREFARKLTSGDTKSTEKSKYHCDTCNRTMRESHYEFHINTSYHRFFNEFPQFRNPEPQRHKTLTERELLNKLKVFCDICQIKLRACFYKNHLESATHKFHLENPNPEQKRSRNSHNSNIDYTEDPLDKDHDPSRSRALICDFCRKRYYRKELLESHIKSHCKSYYIYKCTFCDEKFTTLASMMSHRKKTHATAEGSYHCSDCQRTFRKHQSYVRHCATPKHLIKIGKMDKSKRKEHKNDFISWRRHTCFICNKDFVNGNIYKKHCASEHMEGKEFAPKRETKIVENFNTKCEIDGCGRELWTHNDLQIHYVMDHDNSISFKLMSQQLIICSCGRQFRKSAYKPHLERKHPSTTLCYICGQNFFDDVKGYIYHRDYGHLPMLQCDFCGFEIQSKPMLWVHMKKHIERYSKRFSCEFCGKGFPSSSMLFRHTDGVHAGKKVKKMFKCKLCPKRYLLPEILRKHMKIKHLKTPKLFLVECKICKGEKFPVNEIDKHNATEEHLLKSRKIKQEINAE